MNRVVNHISLILVTALAAHTLGSSSPAWAAEPPSPTPDASADRNTSPDADTASEATPAEPSPEPSAEPPAETGPEPVPSGEPLPPTEPAPLAPAPPAEPEAATTAYSIQNPGEALPIPRPPSPWDKGRIRVSLSVGWASGRSTNWLILGLGGGYHILNGLELGADAAFLLFGDPFIATLTPGVRYTFNQIPILKPYVGAFYRHYFIADDYSDSDSLGGRLGVNFMTSTFSYIGVGAVYEHLLDDSLYSSPDQFYPELAFSFAF